MMNCKVCGKKSESEYCFIHKPKKAIPKTKKILTDDIYETGIINRADEALEGAWAGYKRCKHVFRVE